jgi:enoyl-CoA hydratase
MVDTKPGLPSFETIALERKERLLTVILNRPSALNAFNESMHREIVDALAFASEDEHSDVLVLTGAGRAFSAGGDLAYVAENIRQPVLFEADMRRA